MELEAGSQAISSQDKGTPITLERLYSQEALAKSLKFTRFSPSVSPSLEAATDYVTIEDLG